MKKHLRLKKINLYLSQKETKHNKNKKKLKTKVGYVKLNGQSKNIYERRINRSYRKMRK